MTFLQSGIWHKLEQFDQWLFMGVNSRLSHPAFDQFFLFVRNPPLWVPLYTFIIVFALINFKSRGAWWIVFFLVTVAFTDLTGNYVFKHGFERLRPCNDPDFFFNVRLLVDRCSGGYSFTSNHAANHFGMATFFYFTFRMVLPKIAWIAFVWAAIVAYAQVYVGLHYPFDVLAGALLGFFYGGITAAFFNKRYGFAIFDKQPTLSV